MKYHVITIGGATEDLAIHTDEGMLIDNKQDLLRQKLVAFEYGAKLTVSEAVSTFGGGATNAVVGMSRLGLKTAALIAVGDDDRGKKIIKNLKREKVATKLVQKVRGEMSGFSPVIVGPDNEHVFFSIRGANAKLNIDRRVAKKLADSDWLYLTSLSGRTNDWLESLKMVFSIEGAKIAWNPGHLQLDRGVSVLGKFLARTELLMVNHDEAKELVVSHKKYKAADAKLLDNVKELLKIITAWGPKIAIITRGGKGATAFDGKKYYHVESVKGRKIVNTIGVGDAFGASIVAGLMLFDSDLQKAMLLAKKNTGSVISKHGAQTGLITKEQIGKLN